MSAGWRACVLTVSDRSSRGERPDSSGPLLASLLRELGLEVDEPVVVPDEVPAVQAALREACSSYDLVVTTGGTGLSPRDVTPEATLPQRLGDARLERWGEGRGRRAGAGAGARAGAAARRR
jgi:molybdenum cofactor synthesis domain-containing protein